MKCINIKSRKGLNLVLEIGSPALSNFMMQQVSNYHFSGKRDGSIDILEDSEAATTLVNYIKTMADEYSNSVKNKPAPVMVDDIIPLVNNAETIRFEEDTASGYKERTMKNASADATIAIAVDFDSAGEKLTKKSVLEQNRKYIPIDANNLVVTQERVDKIVESLNSLQDKSADSLSDKKSIVLNIAGNGIYTMKGKYTQQQVDDFTYELLKSVIDSSNLKVKIKSIRTGGQTGFDEAGTKASIKLGLPTLTLAPKGWKFRNANGTDISNEKQFKDRFSLETQNNVTQNSQSTIVQKIYSQLGNKTESGNVFVQKGMNASNYKQVMEKDEEVFGIKPIYSMRLAGDKHFGNPFSSVPSEIAKDLIATNSTRESVEKYIDWVINSTDTRASWIREQLKLGELKNRPILYYKELTEPSHATALDYLINKYDWSSQESVVETIEPKQVVDLAKKLLSKLPLKQGIKAPVIESVKDVEQLLTNLQTKLTEENVPEVFKTVRDEIAAMYNKLKCGQ